MHQADSSGLAVQIVDEADGASVEGPPSASMLVLQLLSAMEC